MRLTLTLVLATTLASRAAAQAPRLVPPPPASAEPRWTLEARGSGPALRIDERTDSSKTGHRAKHALRGAALGAAVGIVAGLVSLRHTDLSCNNGACSRQRNGAVFVTLLWDGAAGAGLGALVGALIP